MSLRTVWEWMLNCCKNIRKNVLVSCQIIGLLRLSFYAQFIYKNKIKRRMIIISKRFSISIYSDICFGNNPEGFTLRAHVYNLLEFKMDAASYFLLIPDSLSINWLFVGKKTRLDGNLRKWYPNCDA